MELKLAKGEKIDLSQCKSVKPVIKATVFFDKEEDIPDNLSDYTIEYVEVPINEEEYTLEPILVKKTGNEDAEYILQAAVVS